MAAHVLPTAPFYYARMRVEYKMRAYNRTVSAEPRKWNARETTRSGP
jgi:hypothetical protein